MGTRTAVRRSCSPLAFVALLSVLGSIQLPSAHAQNASSPQPGTSGDVGRSTDDTNPFSDASRERICCCQLAGMDYDTTGTYQTYQYQDTAPAGCCCGVPGTDCPDLCPAASTSFSSVCGSGQVCGILLLMAALIGTLAVTICITGVLLARRRRQRATLDQFLVPAGDSVHTPRMVSVVRIPTEQLKDLEIKDVDCAEESPTDDGDEEHGGAGQTECPICLEPSAHRVMSAFPCGHSCCRECCADLLRHSSRVVNSTTLAVLCPLCRKLAVGPNPDGARATPSRQQIIVIQPVEVDEEVDAEVDEEVDEEVDDGVDAEVDADVDLEQQAGVEEEVREGEGDVENTNDTRNSAPSSTTTSTMAHPANGSQRGPTSTFTDV
jgi:hypothetical protein